MGCAFSQTILPSERQHFCCACMHVVVMLHARMYVVGDEVLTDARHDSTSNAYHTTVAGLSGRYLLYCIDM